jgi:hypothetical protein
MALRPFNSQRYGRLVVAQQSVQPTGGILPHFQAFFWLRVFPAPQPNPSPPTSG